MGDSVHGSAAGGVLLLMAAASSREIHRLLDEASFVRSLASALAARDVDDVVQGTWLRAMESGAGAVRQPRPWLASVVRSVAHNLLRGRVRRDAHERAAARRDMVPSSAELMEREERRRELVRAVDALPAPQRAVVLLRYFEGLPPRAVAQRLDLQVTTVYTRLRSALVALRQRLDDRLDNRHGARRAWLLPLLPPQAATAGLGTVVLAMTAKTKVVAVVGVLVLAALGLWTLGAPPVPLPPGGDMAGEGLPFTAEVSQGPEQVEGAPRRAEAGAEADRREIVTPAPGAEPTTGSLRVKATYQEDGTPVPDLELMVGSPGAEHRLGQVRVRTDGGGIARLEELAPGRIWVQNIRNDELARSEVAAGAETRLDLVLPPGILVTGIVVDRDGVAVPRAQVSLVPLARADREVEHVADADAQGRFALRSCPTRCLVGARAAGHAPSRLHYVFLREGGTKDLRIQLPAPGGTVEGTVLGPDRRPVRGALVRIGEGHTNGITAGPNGAPAPPALVRTGEDGRFRAVGLAVGEHPVQVRARTLAPWRGACRVQALLTSPLEVTLGLGMSCAGVVVDAEDAPVARAEVEVGGWRDFVHDRAFTSADGTFRLTGLPPGEIELRAEHDRGKACAKIRGNAGETLPCKLRLDRGVELRGRILMADNSPVEHGFVEVRAKDEKSWQGWARADAEGRFVVTNCPEGRKLGVRARGRGVREQWIDDVDPRTGELVIRMEAGPGRSARIVGKVVGQDGRPVAHAAVSAAEREGDRTGLEATSEAGAFELGPLVPGTWRVWVRAQGHPTVWSEWHQVAADAVCDTGTIWLPAGGSVRVRIRGAEGLEPRLTLTDATFSRWHPFPGEGNERRSVLVAPGSYHVSVTGRGVASQLVPVEVRAREQARVEVRVQAGHRQRFSFVAPAPLSERHVRILRGEELVAELTYRARRDWAIPPDWERWLAPGDYTLTASGDGLKGQARFTVREGTDEVVRIVLR